jgi:hypothetical protein
VRWCRRIALILLVVTLIAWLPPWWRHALLIYTAASAVLTFAFGRFIAHGRPENVAADGHEFVCVDCNEAYIAYDGKRDTCRCCLSLRSIPEGAGRERIRRDFVVAGVIGPGA